MTSCNRCGQTLSEDFQFKACDACRAKKATYVRNRAAALQEEVNNTADGEYRRDDAGVKLEKFCRNKRHWKPMQEFWKANQQDEYAMCSSCRAADSSKYDTMNADTYAAKLKRNRENGSTSNRRKRLREEMGEEAYKAMQAEKMRAYRAKKAAQ
jgi:hypothetical protein